MSAGSLPKVQTKIIDLAKYNGEGTIVVKPLSILADARIVDKLAEQARKDGHPEYVGKREELAKAYPMQFSLYAIQECIVDAPGLNPPEKISLDVLDTFSPELFEEVLNAIKDFQSSH